MIYCIVGKTASGKDTFAKQMAKEFQLPFVVSYTTRPKRKYETDGKEHFFLDEHQAKKLTKDYTSCLALTEINGYHYFTTKDQVQKDCIYIIDPNGIEYIKTHFPELKLTSIYVDCSESIILNRAKRRGDNPDVVKSRLDSERSQMDTFFCQNKMDYVLDNNGSHKQFQSEMKRLFLQLQKEKGIGMESRNFILDSGILVDYENYTAVVKEKENEFDMMTLSKLHHIYERLATAEYLFDNYDLDHLQAYHKASEVREYMDKMDVTEEEAIEYVFQNELER